MRILIHIGYPKTATKWFQNQFFPNVSNFQLVENSDIIKFLIEPNALEYDSKKCRRMLLSKYKGNLLISLENIIGTTHNFGLNGYWIKENAVRLKNTFPEAEIILFIRNQYDIIAASYYQYIFAGGTYSIDRYFHNNYKNLYGIAFTSYLFFEFDKTIDLYKELFPKDMIKVFLFEEFRDNNYNFIKQFNKNMDLLVDIKKVKFSYENRRNRVLTMLLFRIFNLFTSGSMANKYYIVNIPYWIDIYRPILIRLNRFKIMGNRRDSFKILRKKNWEFIKNYYKKSNQNLINKHGLNQISEFNYPL